MSQLDYLRLTANRGIDPSTVAEAILQADMRDGQKGNIFSPEAQGNRDLMTAYNSYINSRGSNGAEDNADKFIDEFVNADKNDDNDNNLSLIASNTDQGIIQQLLSLIHSLLEGNPAKSIIAQPIAANNSASQISGETGRIANSTPDLASSSSGINAASDIGQASSVDRSSGLSPITSGGNTMEALGEAAREYALSGQARPHTCAASVSKVLRETMGIETSGHAYQLADQLAQSDQLVEIRVPREEIKELPAGAIVCWDKTNTGNRWTDRYGHVAITAGNGKEASWKLRDQLILSSEARVFVPRDSQLAQAYPPVNS